MSPTIDQPTDEGVEYTLSKPVPRLTSEFNPQHAEHFPLVTKCTGGDDRETTEPLENWGAAAELAVKLGLARWENDSKFRLILNPFIEIKAVR